MKTKLTYEDARLLFQYNSNTGQIFWKTKSCRKVKAGCEAGWISVENNNTYRNVKVNRRNYKVHRIVWLLHYGSWPLYEIDHINGNGLDNRIENLRDVSSSINQRNSRMHKNNTSGVTGVHWHARDRRWYAESCDVFGKQKHIGVFVNLCDAMRAVSEFRSASGYSERHGKP